MGPLPLLVDDGAVVDAGPNDRQHTSYTYVGLRRQLICLRSFAGSFFPTSHAFDAGPLPELASPSKELHAEVSGVDAFISNLGVGVNGIHGREPVKEMAGPDVSSEDEGGFRLFLCVVSPAPQFEIRSLMSMVANEW